MSDKRTIYIVTSGEYSDYGISAVFDSRELAEAMIAGREGYQIEEYTLNPGEVHYREGRSLYWVSMGRDGHVFRVENWGFAHETATDDCWSYQSFRAKEYPEPEWTIATVTAITVDAKAFGTDEQHAIKIVNERRAQWIADGTWDREEAKMRATLQSNPRIWKMAC